MRQEQDHFSQMMYLRTGGRCCDFRGRGEKLLDGGQLVAGNLKVSEALQKAIVSTGYAAAFG